MTIYIIDYTKQDHITKQTWGNRYLVDAATLADAVTASDHVLSAETAFHFDRVDFIHRLVSSATAFDTVFQSDPISASGEGISTGKTMPIFEVMEVVFGKSGGGRPGRKFYHTLYDDAFYDADGTFDDALLSDADTALTAMIAALADIDVTFCDAAGHPYINAVPVPDVKFHQFTKASKRTAP